MLYSEIEFPSLFCLPALVFNFPFREILYTVSTPILEIISGQHMQEMHYSF